MGGGSEGVREILMNDKKVAFHPGNFVFLSDNNCRLTTFISTLSQPASNVLQSRVVVMFINEAKR